MPAALFDAIPSRLFSTLTIRPSAFAEVIPIFVDDRDRLVQIASYEGSSARVREEPRSSHAPRS
ncbi:MAG: hypothetical protein KAY46_11165, partial [Burkholderiaceae bacterium]|nr:hypothetical protein [Burkholderiaceae bacterium]